MRGKQTIKTWGTSQSVIALSYGEPKYCGMVKGGSVGLGLKSDLGDFGVEGGFNTKSDDSAAIAIASRKR